MATNFPTSLDSLTNPTASDPLNNPSHSDQHANVNDAVEALEAKVGADSSAVTTSHTYKIGQLETNALLKTLVDAKGDLLVATGSDVVVRLAVGGTDGHVLTVDSTTSEGIKWAATTNPNVVAQTVETKTGAYTIASGDVGKVIRMNATANFTVDSATGFSVGQKVDVIRIAAGACDVVQGSGATVNGTPGLKLRAQYSAASILCVASNTYYVIGDLSA